jgi:uncharacterized C2H2 Zn-finger protein
MVPVLHHCPTSRLSHRYPIAIPSLSHRYPISHRYPKSSLSGSQSIPAIYLLILTFKVTQPPTYSVQPVALSVGISMTPFQCHVPGCGLSYRRKEHLTRHANSHFQTKCFECSFCDRVFARNDTLRQHVRTQHKTRELQYSRAIQACTYCRSRRSRCDGQSPCGVCFQRGIECSYTQNSRSQALVQSRSRNPRTSPIPSVEQDYPYSFRSPPAQTGGLIQHSESIENSPCRAAPFVQAYFDKFHPKWPFLHPATFDPDNEPPFLVQSVVMVGSWAMMEINTQQTAKDLHKRLTSSIYEQRVSSASSSISPHFPSCC